MSTIGSSAASGSTARAASARSSRSGASQAGSIAVTMARLQGSPPWIARWRHSSVTFPPTFMAGSGPGPPRPSKWGCCAHLPAQAVRHPTRLARHRRGRSRAGTAGDGERDAAARQAQADLGAPRRRRRPRHRRQRRQARRRASARPRTSGTTATPATRAGSAARSLEHLMSRSPEQVVRRSIRGMLPKGPLGRQMLKRLQVYAGPTHPHAAQQPTARALTLDPPRLTLTQRQGTRCPSH